VGVVGGHETLLYPITRSKVWWL